MSNLIFYVLGFISASFVVASLFLFYGMAQRHPDLPGRPDRLPKTWGPPRFYLEKRMGANGFTVGWWFFVSAIGTAGRAPIFLSFS